MIINVNSECSSNLVNINEYGIAPENGKNAIHFKKAGSCKLIINGNEGPIAHLHIKGAKIDSAICLNYNKYFLMMENMKVNFVQQMKKFCINGFLKNLLDVLDSLIINLHAKFGMILIQKDVQQEWIICQIIPI